MKPGNIYGKGDRGKATRLHSLIVRSRGYCQKCSTTLNLECAHIIGRSYASTRTDVENAYCLCKSCHIRFTAHPDEWMQWVDDTIGRDEYDRLKAKAVAGIGVKVDWAAEVERLKTIAKEYGVAA